MYKVFIDGKEGTTGLKIFERFAKRPEIKVLTLEDEDRKKIDKRLECIKKSDVTFLCLPDSASVELVEAAPSNVRIIDTSTAHRTHEDWVYGMPELSREQRELIRGADRVAVPGCHATGFILSVRPLIERGIVSDEYSFSCTSVTGYSGGGKKMIAEYEGQNVTTNVYATGQEHKHLPEMVKMTGIKKPPIFMPIVGNFFSGMHVMVPLDLSVVTIENLKDAGNNCEVDFTEKDEKFLLKALTEVYKEKYKNDIMIEVLEENPGEFQRVHSDGMRGNDGVKLWVSGNSERCVVNALYDNLGKGASGAAVQCMDIMLGMGNT